MFVQVIRGQTSDPAGMRSHVESWASTIGQTAEGWLGTTGGVADDGTSIALVRFESQEAAQRNSDRPEQGEFWEQMRSYFDGDPKFWDCDISAVATYGDPGQAGFVQVMQGKVDDPRRARDLMADDTTDWQSFRPELLGNVWASTDDGEWTMAIYFTSEAEARDGEQKEPPADVAARLEELNSMTTAGPTYLDVRDPWLFSPS